MNWISSRAARGRARRVVPCLALLALGAVGCSDASEQAGASEDGFVPVNPAEGFTYIGETFEVQPGVEGTHCVRVPVPARFADVDSVLYGVDAEIPAGTHHFFMAYSSDPFPGSGDEPVPCHGDQSFLPMGEVPNLGAIGGGKIVMGSGVGMDGYRTAPNTGVLIRKGGHFVTNHHVLNLSTGPLQLYSKINLLLRPASEVEYPSNALNCLSQDVVIDPRQNRVVTATCLAPFDLDLVLLGSHMHQHGVKFETRLYDGVSQQTRDEVIYVSTTWDSPKIVSVEPIRVKEGDGITFSCHYENPSNVQITYGLGVDAEMCAFMGGFTYPQDREPPGLPPTLGTVILDNSVPSTLFDTTNVPTPF